MINREFVDMLEHKDIIFELAAYANQRRAEVGPENVFDFSLGGPSVPPPIEVHQALQELIEEGDISVMHRQSIIQIRIKLRSDLLWQILIRIIALHSFKIPI